LADNPACGNINFMSNPLRDLPAVNAVLDAPALAMLRGDYSAEQLAAAVRDELAATREKLRNNGQHAVPDAELVARRAAERLAAGLRPKLTRVINATGIVLHTNLGRAPMAAGAARAAYDAARGYLNLEMELASGKRSSRQAAVREWLCRLTGAESATAVNNCAAATVIVLRTLAAGKEAIISRGQLIEIGGSFRIPEIMAVSGATLREVGTTNITRIADYERAIGPSTGLLMRVHTSNYRVTGFTQTPTLDELVALGRKTNVPVVDDVGSGALLDFAKLGLTGEPLVRESIAKGADVVLFSGDKLLGGPQAGIIVGKKTIIERVEKDPLMRAFRLDKMTLAALEATLRLYLNEPRALAEVPVLRMLHTPLEELKQQARTLAKRLREIGVIAETEETTAFVGGGSLPEQSLPTFVVAVTPPGLSDEQFAERLRTGEPAVLGRVNDGRLLLDVRTIFADQENELIDAVKKCVGDQL
jgi:L-seryl-tRNA(Ser) seleniumtransferase